MAITAAVAAGLVAMAASYADPPPADVIERAHRLRRRMLQLADDDATAYGAVLAARSAGDAAALQEAWAGAIAVPLEVASAAAELAEHGASLVRSGRPALRGDATAGAWLAEAAARSAARLVALNADESGLGAAEAEQATHLAEQATAAGRRIDS